MLLNWRQNLVLLVLTFGAWGPAATAISQSNPHNSVSARPVTVRDSIEMTRAGYRPGLDTPANLAEFAPDGKHFLVVTWRGNLSTNTTDYSLLLFSTAATLKLRPPRQLLTWSSSTNRAAISGVKWLLDSKTVLFLGSPRGQESQIYSFNILTRKVSQLTHHNTSIVAFDATQDLATIAFLARPKVTKFFDRHAIDSGLVISGQQLADLMIGHGSDKDGGSLYPFECFVSRKGIGVRQVKFHDELPQGPSGVLISPNGRYAIVMTRSHGIPEAWRRYHLPGYILSTLDIYKYMLIDVAQNSIRPLIDAPAVPYTWKQHIAWSPSGKSAIVLDTYLPLEHVAPEEQTIREANVYAAEIEISETKISKIAQGEFDLKSWVPGTNTLVLQPRSQRPAVDDTVVAFRKSGDSWQQIAPQSGEASSTDNMTVTEKEDMNTPPRLIITDQKTGEQHVLLELNPQFRHLRFATVQEITWKGTDGADAKGGLYLPLNYVPDHKYPVVIQTHGWDPNRFWIDGPSSAGYAAQELAGSGFVVVQTPDPTGENTSNEGQRATAMFEGLIDYLDTRHLIDRNRVGLLGWSRTGYHVRYALTFSKYPFAAAAIVDGMDASYVQYMSWLNMEDKFSMLTYDEINGAAPFGSGLELWLHRATGFNLDKVRTPIRLLAFRPYSLLNNWEWFAGLTHMKRPVELIWLPDAEHSPVKPTERVTAQQGNIDWFKFWLKDEEDGDPSKAAQYDRWHKFRKEQTDFSVRKAEMN